MGGVDGYHEDRSVGLCGVNRYSLGPRFGGCDPAWPPGRDRAIAQHISAQQHQGRVGQRRAGDAAPRRLAAPRPMWAKRPSGHQQRRLHLLALNCGWAGRAQAAAPSCGAVQAHLSGRRVSAAPERQHGSTSTAASVRWVSRHPARAVQKLLARCYWPEATADFDEDLSPPAVRLDKWARM